MVRRLLFALVLAFGVLFGSSAAQAREVASTPEIGPLEPAKGALLEAPRDMAIAHGPLPPLPAQYTTRDLGWLELSYPAAAAERVESIVRDANDVKAQLTTAFGQPVLEHVTVRIAPTFADMARLGPDDGPPPAYASGVSYNGRHLVLLTMMAPRGADATDLDEVFRHELAHVAIEDAVQGRHVPVWFNEGVAMWLSGESRFERTQQLWNATLSERLIPLADLDRSFPRDPFEVNIAYAESGDFMRFLLRKSDQLRFASMIDRVREGQPFDRAIAEAYGADLRRLEYEWHGDLERRYSVIPMLTGGGLIWTLLIGALGLAYVRRRRRTKAILARWEREEAIEDARIAKLAATTATADTERLPAIPISVSVKVEQDGGWHTLH